MDKKHAITVGSRKHAGNYHVFPNTVAPKTFSVIPKRVQNLSMGSNHHHHHPKNENIKS